MTLKELLLENKKQLTLYVIGALLTPITGVLFTFAISNAFGIIEETSMSAIYRRIAFAFVFAFSPVLIQLISRFLRIGFVRDVLIRVRTLAYEKVMNHTYEGYKEQPHESYMSMLVSDINLFERDFFLSVLNIIYAFGTSIIGAIILMFISPIMSLTTLAISFLLYVLTETFKPITKRAKRETQQANAYYNSELSNTLHGLEVIKLFQVESNFMKPFESMVIILEQVKKRAFQIDEFQANLNHWIAGTFQVLMYVYATYLYIQQKLSLTLLIVVFNLVGQLLFTMISGFNFVNRIRTSTEIFYRITATSATKDEGYLLTPNPGFKVNALSFAYGNNKVLENLNFEIKPKNKILIYGPSGAGKTTLLNCLAQNLTKYQGTIMVEGHELKTINNASFLKHCGYIRQNHFLFSDTIKNNIILQSAYNQEKFEKIMRQMDLWYWMNELEAKENHQLDQDGSNISGGQRQRISIARELYHERDVLFVDEPSASLDDETSLKIYDTLLQLDKTLIFVSHRHIDYLKDHVDLAIELEILGEAS